MAENGGRRGALKIALYYALFGVVWILGTDFLAGQLAAGEAQLHLFQTVKGWGFVLVSAALLYFLVRRHEADLEEAVRTAEAREDRFRSLVENADDLVFWLAAPDFDEFHYLSPSFRDLFGVSRDRIYGDPAALMELVHPEDRGEVRANRSRAREEGVYESREFRIARPDGETRCMRSQGYPIRDGSGELMRIAGVTQDVTGRRRALEELRSSQRELERSRDLLERYAVHLTSARERERRDLAREIHDHLGQLLTAVKLQLDRAARESGEERRVQLEETTEVVDRALDEVRDLTSQLRPPHLDQLGLTDGLAAYVDDWRESTGIAADVDADLDGEPLTGEPAIHLFRIAQEALTNVARHADAEHVRVELAGDEDELLLRVLDDGRGPGDASPERTGSYGVLGMHERAVLLDGSFELSEREEGGTEVRVRVPRFREEAG